MDEMEIEAEPLQCIYSNNGLIANYYIGILENFSTIGT